MTGNRMRRRAAVVVLGLGWALGACTEAKPGKQSAANPGAVPPDTSQIPKHPRNPAGGTVVSKEQHIQVTNTTGTTMNVVALVGTQTLALGAVEPKQQGSFLLQAEPGMTIHLAASDKTKARQIAGTVVAADTVLHWVIR